jgi:hypothetical protein
MPELFKEVLKFLSNEEELKILQYLYRVELNKTREELIEVLQKLEKLHPQFLFSDGRAGTVDEIEWLIKNKNKFEPSKQDYREFRYRLQQLSNIFAEMLFGEFADQPFDSELVYQISASAFKKMGFRSYVKAEEEKILRVDLTPLGKSIVDYKLIPLISSAERNLGKVLDEYYLENELRVDVGIKPSAFRSLSTGVTTPVHEIIHHISSLYNPNAYVSAVIKSFNHFKDIPVFKIAQDRGIIFGLIDNKVRDEMNKKGFDIRGKDATDPFVLWEVVKRHGLSISEISGIPLNRLYNASFNYLSNYLSFRLLEEGIACYLSVNNADIEEVPKDFAGLENSLKSLIQFGAKLRKLEYLERAIDFYTGEKPFANYYLAELQLYPLAYTYVASRVNLEKPKDVRWYFDLVRRNYLKRNIPIAASKPIKRKKIEEVSPQLARERKIQTMINQINQNIQEYRKRLDEIDKLLKDYKNQLDNVQSLKFDSSSSARAYTNLNKVLDSPRIRNILSREMDNNELLRNTMYVVGGIIVAYGLTKVLDKYLLQ